MTDNKILKEYGRPTLFIVGLFAFITLLIYSTGTIYDCTTLTSKILKQACNQTLDGLHYSIIFLWGGGLPAWFILMFVFARNNKKTSRSPIT